MVYSHLAKTDDLFHGENPPLIFHSYEENDPGILLDIPPVKVIFLPILDLSEEAEIHWSVHN